MTEDVVAKAQTVRPCGRINTAGSREWPCFFRPCSIRPTCPTKRVAEGNFFSSPRPAVSEPTAGGNALECTEQDKLMPTAEHGLNRVDEPAAYRCTQLLRGKCPQRHMTAAHAVPRPSPTMGHSEGPDMTGQAPQSPCGKRDPERPRETPSLPSHRHVLPACVLPSPSRMTKKRVEGASILPTLRSRLPRRGSSFARAEAPLDGHGESPLTPSRTRLPALVGLTAFTTPEASLLLPFFLLAPVSSGGLAWFPPVWICTKSSPSPLHGQDLTPARPRRSIACPPDALPTTPLLAKGLGPLSGVIAVMEETITHKPGSV